jgi:hypothetical protein
MSETVPVYHIEGQTMSKQLDWLAEEVISTFAELGFDRAYILDKRNALAGKDRFAVLVWLNNLDSGCREALANRLGIALNDLDTTIKTLAKL